MRPTLDEIFAEEDEFGLLDVKPAAAAGRLADHADEAVLRDVETFHAKHGRLPDTRSCRSRATKV